VTQLPCRRTSGRSHHRASRAYTRSTPDDAPRPPPGSTATFAPDLPTTLTTIPARPLGCRPERL